MGKKSRKNSKRGSRGSKRSKGKTMRVSSASEAAKDDQVDQRASESGSQAPQVMMQSQEPLRISRVTAATNTAANQALPQDTQMEEPGPRTGMQSELLKAASQAAQQVASQAAQPHVKISGAAARGAAATSGAATTADSNMMPCGIADDQIDLYRAGFVNQDPVNNQTGASSLDQYLRDDIAPVLSPSQYPSTANRSAMSIGLTGIPSFDGTEGPHSSYPNWPPLQHLFKLDSGDDFDLFKFSTNETRQKMTRDAIKEWLGKQNIKSEKSVKFFQDLWDHADMAIYLTTLFQKDSEERKHMDQKTLQYVEGLMNWHGNNRPEALGLIVWRLLFEEFRMFYYPYVEKAFCKLLLHPTAVVELMGFAGNIARDVNKPNFHGRQFVAGPEPTNSEECFAMMKYLYESSPYLLIKNPKLAYRLVRAAWDSVKMMKETMENYRMFKGKPQVYYEKKQSQFTLEHIPDMMLRFLAPRWQLCYPKPHPEDFMLVRSVDQLMEDSWAPPSYKQFKGSRRMADTKDFHPLDRWELKYTQRYQVAIEVPDDLYQDFCNNFLLQIEDKPHFDEARAKESSSESYQADDIPVFWVETVGIPPSEEAKYDKDDNLHIPIGITHEWIRTSSLPIYELLRSHGIERQDWGIIVWINANSSVLTRDLHYQWMEHLSMRGYLKDRQDEESFMGHSENKSKVNPVVKKKKKQQEEDYCYAYIRREENLTTLLAYSSMPDDAVPEVQSPSRLWTLYRSYTGLHMPTEPCLRSVQEHTTKAVTLIAGCQSSNNANTNGQNIMRFRYAHLVQQVSAEHRRELCNLMKMPIYAQEESFESDRGANAPFAMTLNPLAPWLGRDPNNQNPLNTCAGEAVNALAGQTLFNDMLSLTKAVSDYNKIAFNQEALRQIVNGGLSITNLQGVFGTLAFPCKPNYVKFSLVTPWDYHAVHSVQTNMFYLNWLLSASTRSKNLILRTSSLLPRAGQGGVMHHAIAFKYMKNIDSQRGFLKKKLKVRKGEDGKFNRRPTKTELEEEAQYVIPQCWHYSEFGNAFKPTIVLPGQPGFSSDGDQNWNPEVYSMFAGVYSCKVFQAELNPKEFKEHAVPEEEKDEIPEQVLRKFPKHLQPLLQAYYTSRKQHRRHHRALNEKFWQKVNNGTMFDASTVPRKADASYSKFLAQIEAEQKLLPRQGKSKPEAATEPPELPAGQMMIDTSGGAGKTRQPIADSETEMEVESKTSQPIGTIIHSQTSQPIGTSLDIQMEVESKTSQPIGTSLDIQMEVDTKTSQPIGTILNQKTSEPIGTSVDQMMVDDSAGADDDRGRRTHIERMVRDDEALLRSIAKEVVVTKKGRSEVVHFRSNSVSRAERQTTTKHQPGKADARSDMEMEDHEQDAKRLERQLLLRQLLLIDDISKEQLRNLFRTCIGFTESKAFFKRISTTNEETPLLLIEDVQKLISRSWRVESIPLKLHLLRIILRGELQSHKPKGQTSKKRKEALKLIIEVAKSLEAECQKAKIVLGPPSLTNMTSSKARRDKDQDPPTDEGEPYEESVSEGDDDYEVVDNPDYDPDYHDPSDEQVIVSSIKRRQTMTKRAKLITKRKYLIAAARADEFDSDDDDTPQKMPVEHSRALYKAMNDESQVDSESDTSLILPSRTASLLTGMASTKKTTTKKATMQKGGAQRQAPVMITSSDRFKSFFKNQSSDQLTRNSAGPKKVTGSKVDKTPAKRKLAQKTPPAKKKGTSKGAAAHASKAVDGDFDMLYEERKDELPRQAQEQLQLAQYNTRSSEMARIGNAANTMADHAAQEDEEREQLVREYRAEKMRRKWLATQSHPYNSDEEYAEQLLFEEQLIELDDYDEGVVVIPTLPECGHLGFVQSPAQNLARPAVPVNPPSNSSSGSFTTPSQLPSSQRLSRTPGHPTPPGLHPVTVAQPQPPSQMQMMPMQLSSEVVNDSVTWAGLNAPFTDGMPARGSGIGPSMADPKAPGAVKNQEGDGANELKRQMRRLHRNADVQAKQGEGERGRGGSNSARGGSKSARGGSNSVRGGSNSARGGSNSAAKQGGAKQGGAKQGDEEEKQGGKKKGGKKQ